MRSLLKSICPIAVVLAALTAVSSEALAATRCEAPLPDDPFSGPVDLVTGNVIVKLAELSIAGLPVGFYLNDCSTQGSVGIPIDGVSTTLNQELLGALDGTIRLLTPLGERIYLERTLHDGSSAFTTQPDDGTLLRHDGGQWVLFAGPAGHMRYRFARVAGRYFVTQVERDEGPAEAPITRSIVVDRALSTGAISLVHADHTGEELRFWSDASGVHVSHHLATSLAAADRLDLAPAASGRLASFVTTGPNGPVENTLTFGDSGLLHSIDFGALRARSYFDRDSDDLGRVTKLTVVATDVSPHRFVRDVSFGYAASPRSTSYRSWPEAPSSKKTLVFDEQHRTTEVRVGGSIVRSTTYDDLGRVTFEQSPFEVADGLSYEYGPRDRIAKIVRGDGHALYQVVEWDPWHGLPIRLRPGGDDDSEDTFVAYDELGRVSETQLPGGETLARTTAPDVSDPSRTVTCAASSLSPVTSCVTYDAWGFLVARTQTTAGDPLATDKATLVRNANHSVAQMTRTIGGSVIDSASFSAFNHFLLPASASVVTDGQPAHLYLFGYRQDGSVASIDNTTERRRIEVDVDAAGLPAEYRYFEPALFGLPGKGNKSMKLGADVPAVRHTLDQRAACEGPSSESLNGNVVWGEAAPSEGPPPCTVCDNPPPPPQNQPPVPGAPAGGAPIPGGSSPPPFGGLSPGNNGGWNINPPYWIPYFGWPLPGPSLASILFMLGWSDGGPSILPGEGGGHLGGDYVPNIYPDNGGGSPVIQPGVGPRPANTCFIDGGCVGGYGGKTCPDGTAPMTLGDCMNLPPGSGPPGTVCLVDGVCTGGYATCPDNSQPTTLRVCLENAPPSTPTRGYCYDAADNSCIYVGTTNDCPDGSPRLTLSECLNGGGAGGAGGAGGQGAGGADGGVDAGAEAGIEFDPKVLEHLWGSR